MSDFENGPWGVFEYHPKYDCRDGLCGHYRHLLRPTYPTLEEAAAAINAIYASGDFDPDDIFSVEYCGPRVDWQGCDNKLFTLF